MARNNYSWQKRAKELARQEKKKDKIKRRQGKGTASPTEEVPVVEEEGTKSPNGIDRLAEDLG